jgi:hypothetical protein
LVASDFLFLAEERCDLVAAGVGFRVVSEQSRGGRRDIKRGAARSGLVDELNGVDHEG